jgi:hypothetical protein
MDASRERADDRRMSGLLTSAAIGDDTAAPRHAPRRGRRRRSRLLTLVTLRLERAGYEVLTACDGEQATARAW